MKFLNDFKNVFAIVGVVSIIFWTCASESTSTNVNPPQLTGGNYQIEYIGINPNNNVREFVALNTETGVAVKYIVNPSAWGEATELGSITLTH